MTVVNAHRPQLELLVLADVHYVGQAAHTCSIEARKARWGLELVRRVLRRTQSEAPVDAVVLMGDLVDNGEAPGAGADLRKLRDELRSTGLPLIAVPGNHDGCPERLLRIFGDRIGVHELAGFRLITFADAYASDDSATRSRRDLARLDELRREGPARPIIALQHNPVHPPIESTYPYNLTNADEVMRTYERYGVLLSVSAHYHPGTGPRKVDGVTYVTCPALCEAPMQATRLSVSGRCVSVRNMALAMTDQPVPLIDFHCHSEYAYCADDVTAYDAIQRANAFGIERVHITEHAGHLYLSPEDYWSGAFRRDAGIIRRRRDEGHDRMDQFRAEVTPLRSARVGIGLEVELDAVGRLTLLDEDQAGWDVLVGAVHAVPATDSDRPDPAEVARDFMRDTTRLIESGIDILAHPFRLFRRKQMPVPAELYAPTVDLLAAHGVAAEVNYHTNEPDPRFFALCAERGVKIALGSDAHGLWEVGDFAPHLALLSEVAPADTWAERLYWGRHDA